MMKKEGLFMKQNRKQQKGIALLLAMFTITIVSFLAIELSYETNIEYIVNAQAIQRVKAYYAARSAMDLSLLRIKIYTQVRSQFAQQLGNNTELIEMIWNMPFAWPPVLPTEINEVDKGLIQDKIKESSMDTSYIATISDEGSKIDLNDLNSPSKVFSELTKKRILQIIDHKNKEDDIWAKNNSELRPEEIVQAIQDWVTPSQTAKTTQFSNLGEGFPPNRAFRTVDELRLVPGVTESVFELLKDQVTVYGMKAINPNQAPKEVLMSLDPTINSEVAAKLIERRTSQQKGGPYKDANDFWGYVATSGGRVEPDLQQAIPLVFNAVYNFRIHATGNFKNSTREITSIVYDLQKTAQQVSDQLKKSENPSDSKSNPSAGGTNNSVSKGPPRVVYWNER